MLVTGLLDTDAAASFTGFNKRGEMEMTITRLRTQTFFPPIYVTIVSKAGAEGVGKN